MLSLLIVILFAVVYSRDGTVIDPRDGTECSSWESNTVGVLRYEDGTYPGYVLSVAHWNKHAYLLNNCGEIVHTWEDTNRWDDDAGSNDETPMPRLLPDGRLIKLTKNESLFVYDGLMWDEYFPPSYTTLEIRDWDNALLWSWSGATSRTSVPVQSFAITDDNPTSIIGLAYEKISSDDARELGRNPELPDAGEMWMQWVYEVDVSTDEIIWEWHLLDHLIQDYNASLPNFVNIQEHPEKVDVNYDVGESKPMDWTHGNAIDYNPEEDLVLLSIPRFNELWVIDHSTTTAEAASSEGGIRSSGGDILWRFGNPAVWQADGSQALFYQHDSHFVKTGTVDPPQAGDRSYEGMIAVMNNRAGDDFTRLEIIDPEGFQTGTASNFNNEFLLSVEHEVPTEMFSSFMGSVQVLSNGNFFVDVGPYGKYMEITETGHPVWEYQVPLRGAARVFQGDEISYLETKTFRARRYEYTYEAFQDRDLTTGGYLERYWEGQTETECSGEPVFYMYGFYLALSLLLFSVLLIIVIAMKCSPKQPRPEGSGTTGEENSLVQLKALR